jgi:hypothetical protein
VKVWSLGVGLSNEGGPAAEKNRGLFPGCCSATLSPRFGHSEHGRNTFDLMNEPRLVYGKRDTKL